MKIYINNKLLEEDYIVSYDSLNIEKQVKEQKICSFSFLKIGRPFPVIRKFMPVRILGFDNEVIFNGYISSPREGQTTMDTQEYSVTCVGQDYLTTKVLIAKGYEKKDIAEIVRDIHSNYLLEEGITIGRIDSGVFINQESFNYVTCRTALQKLADRCDFVFHVDDDKQLYFIRKENNVEETEINFENVIGDISIDRTQDNYCNIQYLTGVKDTTTEQVEEFKLSSDISTFVLKFPVAKQPKIELVVNGVTTEQTVGINGLNTGSADFYYTYNSSNISCDANFSITEGTIRITYIGLYDIVVKAMDYEEISIKKDIDGTSGKVEVVEEVDYTGFDVALEAGYEKINKNKQDTTTLKFISFYPFSVGKLANVYLPEKGITKEQLLITKVKIFTNNNSLIYDVEAVKGPASDSWTEFFIKDKQKTKAFENEEKTVVQPIFTYQKIWEESEKPNMFAEPLRLSFTLPFRLRFSSSTKIKYIAWCDNSGKELGRKQVVSEKIAEDRVSTIAFIGATEYAGKIACFKWYGGTASNEPNSGLLVDVVEVDLNKTKLEVYQIQRIDKKGW